MSESKERDWRVPLAECLVETMHGEGFHFYNQDLADEFLNLFIRRESHLPESKRSGFLALAEYKDTGITKFFKLVKDLWNTKLEKPMSLQTPTPPKSSHAFDAVITVKLDKDSYDVEKMHEILKTYLIETVASPFDCLVIQVAKVFGCWYDVKIRYSCNLIDVFKILTGIPWVKDAVVRPLSDFGIRTLALLDN